MILWFRGDPFASQPQPEPKELKKFALAGKYSQQ